MSGESQSDLAARAAVVRELAKKLRQSERSRQPGAASLADVDAFANRKRDASVSTGIEPLDQLLPDGGFLRGTIVEWVCDEIGSGAQTLSLISAANVLRHRVQTPPADSHRTSAQNLVVIDAAQEFYPLAAAGLGIDLHRTVVVRPGPNPVSGGTRNNDVLWALEQALRSEAVGLTVCAIDHLNGHTFRRLQLAAEAGGGICFLRRPLAAMRQPTWADVRLLVKSRRQPASAMRARQLERTRVLRAHHAEKVRVNRNTTSDPRERLIDSERQLEQTRVLRAHHAEKVRVNRNTTSDPRERLIDSERQLERTRALQAHHAERDGYVTAVRRLTVELLKCRSGLTGGTVELDYHDETHDVRLAAELARPAATERSARA